MECTSPLKTETMINMMGEIVHFCRVLIAQLEDGGMIVAGI